MGRAGSRAAGTARLLLLVAATTCAQQPFESRTAPAAGPATALQVNTARLRQTLEKLSEFGRPAGGTFADGVTRLGFSEADLAAREYVSGLMREAGLE
ncbi:MAG: hypothetical protein K6U02_03570, partial [Firmicutes bacterium]|nr:hypothetical protein [Bacillota bacterium]